MSNKHEEVTKKKRLGNIHLHSVLSPRSIRRSDMQTRAKSLSRRSHEAKCPRQYLSKRQEFKIKKIETKTTNVASQLQALD